jgi:hypothetical protein
MYNQNMKNYIDENNRENIEKIDKNNFFNKILKIYKLKNIFVNTLEKINQTLDKNTQKQIQIIRKKRQEK